VMFRLWRMFRVGMKQEHCYKFQDQFHRKRLQNHTGCQRDAIQLC